VGGGWMKTLFFSFVILGCSAELGVKKNLISSGPDGQKLEDPKPQYSSFKEGLKQSDSTSFNPIFEVQEVKSEESINTYKSVLDSLLGGLSSTEITSIAKLIPRDNGPDLTAFEIELNNKIKNIEANFCENDLVPTFDTEILPIMTKYCIACHQGTFATINGISYTLYKNFGKTPIATTVINAFNGTRMPPAGLPKPSTCVKGLISRWVAGGSP
jgi:hypothetical protein